MLLFLPMAIAQIIEGVIYESEQTLTLYIMSVGMVIVAMWAYFKVNDPKDLLGRNSRARDQGHQACSSCCNFSTEEEFPESLWKIQRRASSLHR